MEGSNSFSHRTRWSATVLTTSCRLAPLVPPRKRLSKLTRHTDSSSRHQSSSGLRVHWQALRSRRLDSGHRVRRLGHPWHGGPTKAGPTWMPGTGVRPSAQPIRGGLPLQEDAKGQSPRWLRRPPLRSLHPIPTYHPCGRSLRPNRRQPNPVQDLGPQTRLPHPQDSKRIGHLRYHSETN